jgi:NADPH-dependent 2,4-dienoyl-CoA reductase/sulfur reductase-like enzyme
LRHPILSGTRNFTPSGRPQPRRNSGFVQSNLGGNEFFNSLLELDNGAQARAGRVVIAVGVGPFRYVPETLSRVLGRFASHSFDHHDLTLLAGTRVAVIGGGASAIDLAGLLHERGSDVVLVTRRPALRFSGTSGARACGRASLWHRIRHPPSGLGPGLRSRFSTDAPLLIHALPKSLRLEFVRRHLGPAAAGVMKDKVIGRVPLLLDRKLVDAAVEDGQVALTMSKKDGREDVLHVDHVIAATGFRTDVSRLIVLGSNPIACCAGCRRGQGRR